MSDKKKLKKKTPIKTSLENEFLKKEQYFVKMLETETNEDKRNEIRKERDEYYIKNYNIFNEYFNDQQGKASKYEKYLELNDESYGKKTIESEETNFCKKCNTFKIVCNIDAIMVCPVCFEQTNNIIEPEKPSFKDPPHDNYFSYKRENHYKDHLNRVQAKETTKIKPEVEDVVYYEFCKEQYTNLADLDETKVRAYLKKYIKYGFNKYYENAQQIINKITGIKPLDIPIEREKKLYELFLRIEKAFAKHCPESRCNLISYQFIIYKECEILGYDEYLPYFTLLKSNDRKQEQNEVWKKICEDEGLPYYP